MTIFLITSPFQAICSFQFIKERNIDDYYIIVHVVLDDSRLKSILNFLYSEIPTSKIYILDVKFKKYIKIRRRLGRCDDIIIGDCFDLRLLLIAILLLKPLGFISYVDDGASSLQFFNDSYKGTLMYNFKKNTLHILRLFKLIKIRQFFTIFHPNKSKIHLTYNDLSYLRDLKTKRLSQVVDESEVVIIGTNISEYCKSAGILESDYLKEFEKILKSLLSYNSKIKYIKHGRCQSKAVVEILNKYGIIIHIPKCTIEIDYIQNNETVSTVLAFDSTAIYTMKLLYPISHFINYQIISKKCKNPYYEHSRKYLKEHWGIETTRIYI